MIVCTGVNMYMLIWVACGYGSLWIWELMDMGSLWIWELMDMEGRVYVEIHFRQTDLCR